MRGVKKVSDEYIFPDKLDYIDTFSKVNVFVGENNSGKSRFMRSIIKLKNDDRLFEGRQVFRDFISEIETNYLPKLNMRQHPGLCPKSEQLIKEGLYGNVRQRVQGYINTIENIQNGTIGRTDAEGRLAHKLIEDNWKTIDAIKGIDISSVPSDLQQIYIPMLRGLRKVSDTDPDPYSRVTNNDYSIESKENNSTVFTGQAVYEKVRNMLLGNSQERQLIRNFELFLGHKFFNSKRVTLIPNEQEKTLYLDIGDEKDRAIHNVGDGIQALIIITMELFLGGNSKNLIFYVEEPEMTLHPHMQRVLIELFADDFPNCQLFVTTHSNHFLDLTYDHEDNVEIYSFKREDEKKLIRRVTENSDILELLGVRNSSVYLANSVIWVEGVTDRMFLRALLKANNFSSIEDYNYAIAEYGGINLGNYAFNNEVDDRDNTQVNVKAISRNNFVLMDNDKLAQDSSNFRARREIIDALGKKSTDSNHVEIENLIKGEVWLEVAKIEAKNRAYKIKPDAKSKIDNFNSQLDREKIGTLIRRHFIELNDSKQKPKYFSNTSITCLGIDKKPAMELALSLSEREGIEPFTPAAQKLYRKLSKFISQAN